MNFLKQKYLLLFLFFFSIAKAQKTIHKTESATSYHARKKAAKKSKKIRMKKKLKAILLMLTIIVPVLFLIRALRSKGGTTLKKKKQKKESTFLKAFDEIQKYNTSLANKFYTKAEKVKFGMLSMWRCKGKKPLSAYPLDHIVMFLRLHPPRKYKSKKITAQFVHPIGSRKEDYLLYKYTINDCGEFRFQQAIFSHVDGSSGSYIDTIHGVEFPKLNRVVTENEEYKLSSEKEKHCITKSYILPLTKEYEYYLKTASKYTDKVICKVKVNYQVQPNHSSQAKEKVVNINVNINLSLEYSVAEAIWLITQQAKIPFSSYLTLKLASKGSLSIHKKLKNYNITNKSRLILRKLRLKARSFWSFF